MKTQIKIMLTTVICIVGMIICSTSVVNADTLYYPQENSKVPCDSIYVYGQVSQVPAYLNIEDPTNSKILTVYKISRDSTGQIIPDQNGNFSKTLNVYNMDQMQYLIPYFYRPVRVCIRQGNIYGTMTASRSINLAKPNAWSSEPALGNIEVPTVNSEKTPYSLCNNKGMTFSLSPNLKYTWFKLKNNSCENINLAHSSWLSVDKSSCTYKPVEDDTTPGTVSIFCIVQSPYITSQARLLRWNINLVNQSPGTAGWDICDNYPSGAAVSSMVDSGGMVIVNLRGAGLQNAYRYRNSNGTNWNETQYKTMQWKMKYTENFAVYVDCETTAGHRYLYYRDTANDVPGNIEYPFHQLDSNIINGQWQTITRDLQQDLKDIEPTNSITSINSFIIRGSGDIRDIVLIDSTAPQPISLGTITPSSGSVNTGQRVTFTTTYTDLNGVGDIKFARFIINTSPSEANCFDAWYEQAYNRIYLFENGVGTHGSPGGTTILDSKYGKLYCSGTTVSKTANTITIKWDVEFKTPLAGGNNMYLSAQDYYLAETGIQQRGTITIVDILSYNLNLIAVNGTITKEPNQTYYTPGTQVKLTATADSGYHFVNWTGDLTGTANPATITMNSNKTITGNFALNHPPAVGTVTPASGSQRAEQYVIFTTTYTDPAGAEDISGVSFMVNTTSGSEENCFYAWYEQDRNLIWFLNSTGGMIGSHPGDPYLVENSYCALACDGTSVSKNGNTLTITWKIKFKDTFTGTKNLYLSVTDKVGSHVDWQQKGTWTVDPLSTKYFITVNTTPDGKVTLNPAQPSSGYDWGTVVTLTAVPNSGYVFAYWTGDTTGSINPATIKVDGNKTVAANFGRPTCYLTINTTNGYVEKSPNQSAYAPGTIVTLTAKPNRGYSFSSWSGDITGSANPATITMNGSKTVTANFITNPPPVAWSITPATGSSVVGQQVSFTTTCYDPSGANDISNIYFIIGSSFQDLRCFNAYYNRSSNKLYMISDAGTYIGGYAPGSANTIWNSICTLYCNASSVSISGDYISVTWSVKFNSSTFTGAKNMYLTVYDSSSNSNSLIKGPWNINPASAPYSITINAVNGTVVKNPDQTSYAPGTVVTLTAVPNSLYQFSSWSGDVTGTSNPATVTMNSNKTVTANFEVKPPLSLGEITPSSGYSNAGEFVTFTTTYKSINGASYIENAEMIINTSVSAARCFNGLYNNTNNTIALSNDAGTLLLGGYAPGSANMIENSYCKIDCSGSSVTKSGETLTVRWKVMFKSTFTGSKNMYLHAIDRQFRQTEWQSKGTWTINATTMYNLTINSSNGSVTCSPSSSTYSPNTVVTLTANPASGYRFSNWSGDLTGTANPATITMNSNKTVTATFFAITGNPSVGTAAAIPNPVAANQSTLVTTTYTHTGGAAKLKEAGLLINTVMTSGSNCFLGYYDCANNKLWIKDDNDTAKLGNFAPGSANIIENSYCKLDCSGTTVTKIGDTLTVTWKIIFKSTFTGTKNMYLYANDINGYNTTNWAQKGTITINPALPAGYTLVINAGNGGTVTKSPDQPSYSAGTVVTLTAYPDSGYKFSSWSGYVANTNANPTTIVMSDNRTVSANFAVNTITVGTVTTPNPVASNQPATISAAYIDQNGTTSINDAKILVNTTMYSGKNCMHAWYNQATNKLYLKADDDYLIYGGYAPGSANIIENSYCKIDCSGTTITRNGKILMVSWKVTFKPAFTGTKNIYLYASDVGGATTGEWEYKTAVTIQ